MRKGKCTWLEKVTPFAVYYKTDCGYYDIFGRIRPAYKYCPGCGRKIEWVEEQKGPYKNTSLWAITNGYD